MRNNARDPLTGHRSESWRWDLLDLDDHRIGVLDGVSGGRLEFSVSNTIRGGGSLKWKGDSAPDWLTVRLQPWYTLRLEDGTEESWPLGVFVPATPKTEHDDDGIALSVDLYDKLLVLDQDKVEETYTVAGGVVVTTAIREIILSAGEEKLAIEDSTQFLTSPMVWEAGTSKLRIVNDLLAAINYFSLWVDGYGVYNGTPYSAPSARGSVRTFADDEFSIYSPAFTHDEDTFSVPNKVVLVARTDGEEEALSAVATNDDPESRYSYTARGRWITVFESDVEATSQATLDGIAARRLAELGSVTSTFEIRHALIPLDLNDVVVFERAARGILARRAVVQAITIDTDLGALVSTTLREVSA